MVGAGLVDGLVDGGLEAALVEHHAGVLEVRGLARLELEVVRLLAGLGQVDDVHVAAADPLGDELQGVERGDHLGPSACGGTAAAARGQQRRGDDEQRRQNGGRGDPHGNHSQDE